MEFFEIDFLEAGNKQSGDAIALRYGNLDSGEISIHIVDGGFDLLPNLSPFISKVCSGYGPVWTGLQTHSA